MLRVRRNSGILLLCAFVVKPKYVKSPLRRIINEAQVARTSACCLSRSCHFSALCNNVAATRSNASKGNWVFERKGVPSFQTICALICNAAQTASAVLMKARKIRQRSAALADDDNQEESAAEAVRKSIAARKQQKDKKANQKPLLSFDDEDETHVAPVKRAPAKLKPDLKGLKLASDSAKTSTQRSAPGTGALLLTLFERQVETSLIVLNPSNAGDYSAERLLELQRNTNRLPPSKPAADTTQATSQPAFKLAGSFKQAGASAAPPQVRAAGLRPNVLFITTKVLAFQAVADRNDLQAFAKATTQIPQDPDDEMPLPPPARPASRPPLPPSASAHAGTRSSPGDQEGLDFEAPDADTIRYTC